ncbi:Uu.00g008690.m01.CDS01 [Anthostomella pinea]|uniref:Uu.00g008690.m01.CDS01 n=1 Tax=Anthostomella pinea TaxID=933095 RepID=A0AAI8VY52_9PEZI|nr:Uu.00g008690.m01.CDS01 [Anthostomella pinea]
MQSYVIITSPEPVGDVPLISVWPLWYPLRAISKSAAGFQAPLFLLALTWLLPYASLHCWVDAPTHRGSRARNSGCIDGTHAVATARLTSVDDSVILMS